MKTLGCAIWVALGASLALRALAQPTPAQAHLREIYRELVEINTTDSAWSCTAAAEAMAARLKAGGLPAQEVQIIVPPGGPQKGNLVTRYRREGYRPERDLILVATCDEEIIPSNFSGIVYLLKNHRDLIDAEFALNEGGNGLLDKSGNPLRMTIQAGEKVFQTYQLEVTNPGGHSPLPAKDNPITLSPPV